MSGRLEDSAAFRGYINKNNLDISPLVYTVPPAVVGDVLYHYRDKEIKPMWNDAPDATVMKKLMQVPYFVKCYEEDGYAVEQFDEITSLKENAAVFSAATNEMIDFVGKLV